MLKQIGVLVFSACLLVLGGCQSTGPKYQNVGSYSEGLAAVQNNNGKWGYINERQVWVIQAKFDEAREFKGGRASVKQNGKWGFINKRGEWL